MAKTMNNIGIYRNIIYRNECGLTIGISKVRRPMTSNDNSADGINFDDESVEPKRKGSPFWS